MNKVITSHVYYRGSLVPVESLKENSNIKVLVECPHGQRFVRWSRRNQLCRKCASELGLYDTSKPGRAITWGDKISSSKKGKKLSDQHRQSLIQSRKSKIAHRLNRPLNEVEFPTKGYQYKLRAFLMNAIKRNILNKSISVQDALIFEKLGYSVEQLKQHLESKFEPWMTWDNYGEWEIDHVTPESWFKYDSVDSEDFKRCWALSNLQPMAASANRKKNNLYAGAFREKVIYMLCGQSGVGKSTVAAKLTNIFTVLDKDNFRNIKELDKAIRNNWHNELPILLQVSVHIATTIERYTKMGYKVVPFFIVEEPDIIKQRIAQRGGNRVDNVESRHRRILALAARYAAYSATADDMIKYIWSNYGQKAT